ncbi:hypothetical protein [Streptomyces sp. MNU89]|uniref:hypothetical protein n=1 Tax=Streptomyces sp. MNU89 TaxID=2560025 RepID=UPI001E3A21AB|nr:hypothetical protein [Streptomyces sp. MNU89]MCC9740828.1 hypothetical protein [Streptomyces sp. MNU89]
MADDAEIPGALPEPWWVPSDITLRGLERQLATELGPDHTLHGCDVNAVAKRQDCDDVLFSVSGQPFRWAVVHLTWRDRPDTAPWPMTTAYVSFSEFLEGQSDLSDGARASEDD